MDEQEFFVRCASGFESLLAEEIKSYRIKRVRPLKGGVAFFGSLEQGLRVCLWSRVASRVLLVLDRIDACDGDSLYLGVQGIDWTTHIAPGKTIAIHAHGVNDSLRNTQFSALKTKDAICDQLRDRRGARPDVQAFRPDVMVDIALRKDRATVSIDLSGESLHRRGYRKEGIQSVAPLKENLAAALVLESGWQDCMREGQAFVDPMCGSGTLAIEAALIAADGAPGMLRDYWGFSGWAQFDEALWDSLVEEADERFARALKHMPPIFASDKEATVVELAEENAKRAGLKDCIAFSVLDVAELSTFVTNVDKPGLILTNPPYGERLGSPQQLPALYTALSKGLEALGDGWRFSVITPDESIDAALGYTPDKLVPFYNGRIETNVRSYVLDRKSRVFVDIHDATTGRLEKVAVMEKNSADFAARLKKISKERRKWARKNNIDCYRIYDADLPDYSVAIDYYRGSGTSQNQDFLVIAEYQAPRTIDEDRARRRLSDVVTLAPRILDVLPENTFVKVRRKDKGGGQYAKAAKPAYRAQVRVSGFLFELDFESYLDTGLFLDHRSTREMIGTMAKGKRFLNLFAYTGSATVHAAGGGASQTTTVDLSQTYLSWAKRNMALNGFEGENHHYCKGDTLSWLKLQIKKNAKYDLVFVDPPTFSNSKTMGKSTWSVERDHVELLRRVTQVLAPEGIAVFSCNLRSFKINYKALDALGIKVSDISPNTIPEDFRRNPKIHYCYLITLA